MAVGNVPGPMELGATCRVEDGTTFVRQGEPGTLVYLILQGLAKIQPGGRPAAGEQSTGDGAETDADDAEEHLGLAVRPAQLFAGLRE